MEWHAEIGLKFSFNRKKVTFIELKQGNDKLWVNHVKVAHYSKHDTDNEFDSDALLWPHVIQAKVFQLENIIFVNVPFMMTKNHHAFSIFFVKFIFFL